MSGVKHSHIVDIIIPVHNRPELTKQTIDSLYAHTDKDLFRLYVVDDLSNDETKKVLKELQRTYVFRLFTNDENIGPAASRNEVCEYITLRKKRGGLLYHSDNDVYFKEGWLPVLIKAYASIEREGIRLLGGGCHPYLQNNSTVRYIDFTVGIKDAVSGYSQLMTWDTWDKYGPFDEGQGSQKIKIMGSEDWAFCQRIIQDGYKVGSIEPELVIATGKTNTYGQPATGAETFKEVEGIKIL